MEIRGQVGGRYHQYEPPKGRPSRYPIKQARYGECWKRQPKPKPKKPSNRKLPKTSRAVRIDGVEYASMSLAERELGLNRGAVCSAVKFGKSEVCGMKLEVIA